MTSIKFRSRIWFLIASDRVIIWGCHLEDPARKQTQHDREGQELLPCAANWTGVSQLRSRAARVRTMQGWKPLEPLAPPFGGDATGCKETYRVKGESPFEASFDGLETTTSLGDLDLISSLFPSASKDFTQDAATFLSQASAGPPAEPSFLPADPDFGLPAGPSTLPHSSSSGSSELFHRETQGSNPPGHESEKPDTKTAQASKHVAASLVGLKCGQSC